MPLTCTFNALIKHDPQILVDLDALIGANQCRKYPFSSFGVAHYLQTITVNRIRSINFNSTDSSSSDQLAPCDS